MSELLLLQRMAGNNAWSNFRLYRALAGLSRDEFVAPGVSFFPSIPATLNHILIVDWFYVDGLTGGGRGQACFVSDEPFSSLADLDREQRASDVRLLDFVNGLAGDAALDRKVELDRGGRTQVETVRDLLLHLYQHQIHHRGQVHAMMAGTSVKPPQLDEFFPTDDLGLRRAELEALGLPIR